VHATSEFQEVHELVVIGAADHNGIDLERGETLGGGGGNAPEHRVEIARSRQ
jgi:hypothetical protein